ncbi:unnamed protein product [Fusarium graminearum]|nr:unnamed protein product [Fusarium graminearum]
MVWGLPTDKLNITRLGPGCPGNSYLVMINFDTSMLLSLYLPAIWFCGPGLKLGRECGQRVEFDPGFLEDLRSTQNRGT